MNNILALYYRLSLADHGKEEFDISNSIKNQEILLKDYVRNHTDLQQYELMEFYDDGYSGTNFQRPAIQKIFDLMKLGKIKCIIVKDFSRFGRNYIEVGTYLEQIFPFLKVRFISVNDHFDSNKDNAAGAIDVGFKNLMHDYYSKNMGKKIAQAKKFKAENGTMRIPAFFGYKKAEDNFSLVIDMEAAEVVRILFRKRLEGLSLRDIAKFMNARGIFTPGQYRLQLYNAVTMPFKLWNANIVAQILKDIRYTGTFVYGKRKSFDFRCRRMPESTWIVVKECFEPIISQEIFDAVSKTMYSRDTQRNIHSKIKPLFSGKLQCGYCGNTLKKRRTGYKCTTGESLKHSNCPKIIYREELFINIVLQSLNKFIEVTDFRKYFTAEKDTDEIERLNGLLVKCQSDILCAYEMYSDEKMTRSEYMEKHGILKRKKEEIISSLDSIKNGRIDVEKKEKISMILSEHISDGKIVCVTPDLLDTFIEKLVVYDNERIEVVWRYRDVFTKYKEK